MRNLFPEIIAKMEKKVPYASVLSERGQGITITKDKKNLEISEIPHHNGVVFSAFNGSYFEETAVTDCTLDNLVKAATGLVDSMSVLRFGMTIDPGDGGEQNFYTKMEINPLHVDLSEKVERVIKLQEKAMQLDKRVVNAVVSYQEVVNDKIFVNRSKNFSQSIMRVSVRVSLFVSDGVKVVNNGQNFGKTAGFEVFDEATDTELERLRAETIEILEADPITPAYYEIISSPDVSGIIAHETFGHGVEMDLFLKEGALAKDYYGKTLAAPFVNVLDDPSIEGAYGSYFFDDEGYLAKPTYIIEDGIFKNCLTDLFSASHLPYISRSANGRREDFSRKVYARMSNTFFGAGESSLEEMIDSIKYGIYVEKAYYGMEDPKGWGMQVNSRIGREIKDGRLTGKIFAPIAMTGNVLDLLKDITMVGKIFDLRAGKCNKRYKETVIVSTGGPHLRTKARLS